MTASSGTAAPVRLGLAANATQFWLLVAVNAFVGSMVGIERDVLPLVGQRVFGLASETAVLSFIVTFGFTKALANLYAGRTADRIGRKPLLIAGWLVAVPVPLLLMYAPAWGWIVFANVLLGINQGLCWSMTVVMKIDLVGPKQRGLAMGLNEFAGYLAVGVAAYLSGAIAAAYGLRPWPFAGGSLYARNLFAYYYVTAWLHAVHIDPDTSLAYGDTDDAAPAESWQGRIGTWRLDRSPRIAQRIVGFANTGAIRCKLIEIAAEYDHLVPPQIHDTPYCELIAAAGMQARRRGTVVPFAQHVDSWSESPDYPQMRTAYREVWNAFDELVAWVE